MLLIKLSYGLGQWAICKSILNINLLRFISTKLGLNYYKFDILII